MYSVRLSPFCPLLWSMARTDGLLRISREEGLRGHYKGTTLALIGISNGAIQFVTYERMKRWARDRKHRKRGQALGGEGDTLALVRSDCLLSSCLVNECTVEL